MTATISLAIAQLNRLRNSLLHNLDLVENAMIILGFDPDSELFVGDEPSRANTTPIIDLDAPSDVEEEESLPEQPLLTREITGIQLSTVAESSAWGESDSDDNYDHPTALGYTKRV